MSLKRALQKTTFKGVVRVDERAGHVVEHDAQPHLGCVSAKLGQHGLCGLRHESSSCQSDGFEGAPKRGEAGPAPSSRVVRPLR